MPKVHPESTPQPNADAFHDDQEQHLSGQQGETKDTTENTPSSPLDKEENLQSESGQDREGEAGEGVAQSTEPSGAGQPSAAVYVEPGKRQPIN